MTNKIHIFAFNIIRIHNISTSYLHNIGIIRYLLNKNRTHIRFVEQSSRDYSGALFHVVTRSRSDAQFVGVTRRSGNVARLSWFLAPRTFDVGGHVSQVGRSERRNKRTLCEKNDKCPYVISKKSNCLQSKRSEPAGIAAEMVFEILEREVRVGRLKIFTQRRNCFRVFQYMMKALRFFFFFLRGNKS